MPAAIPQPRSRTAARARVIAKAGHYGPQTRPGTAAINSRHAPFQIAMWGDDAATEYAGAIRALAAVVDKRLRGG